MATTTTKTIVRTGRTGKAVQVSEPGRVGEALRELDRLYTALGRRSPEYREALSAFRRVF